MRASEILARESAVHNDYLARGELTAGQQGTVPVFDYKPRGRDNYYYAEQTAKTMIVLHFTAGYLWGDLDTLTTDDLHVSVPFVVARNGRIYRLFDPRQWSYHLGNPTKGGNEFNSKRSIGIEISNLGCLTKDGSNLKFGSGVYCTEAEPQYFFDNGSDYRKVRYYAAYTAAQYASVKALLDQLCGQFNIPRQLLPPSERLELFADDATAQNYRGIATHVNYRPEPGKWDVGPAFDWSKI